MTYVRPGDIAAGDTVAPGGMFAARGVVTDITDSSSGVARQYGALVLWVDYLNGRGSRPVTLFPHHDIWRDES